MKTHTCFIISIYLTIVSCNPVTSSVGIEKPLQIATFYAYDHSSLAFLNDSALVLYKRKISDTEFEYLIDRYYIQTKLSWNEIEQKKDLLSRYHLSYSLSQGYENSINDKMINSSLYLPNILQPNINYSLIDTNSASFSEFDELECNKILIHTSGSYIYRLCRGMVKSIKIYDTVTKKEKILELYDSPKPIKDFFVSNVAGDAKNEIIVFLKPPYARDVEAVEINVFSISE